MCDFQCKQERVFLKHLTENHNIADYETHYVDIVLNGKQPLCACGCGEKVPFNCWKKGFTTKFLRGHNAVIDTNFTNPDSIKKMAEKRIQGFKTGKYKVWNDGLTKETSEIINTSSQKISATHKQKVSSGEFVDWRIKEPTKALNARKKISETKRKQFESGSLKVWNKGLTKETSDIVNSISIKMKTAFDKREIGRRIKIVDLTKRIEKFDQFELISSVDDYRKRRVERLLFKCKACQSIRPMSLAMLEEAARCLVCNPKTSKPELEMFEFVRSLMPDTISGDRTVLKNGKELDIYVPSRRFGIEFNGLYYHSEKFLSNDYHRNKLLSARESQISLMNVFEDEWRDKQDIVKSMISSRLGKINTIIAARKCELVELDAKLATQFFSCTHLSGHTRSIKIFGLVYEGEIVAALSIRKPFHRKYESLFEIARFSSKLNTQVQGALGKLTNEAMKFVRNSDKKGLLSYVDLNHGDGHSYEKTGFIKQGETPVQFWWTDCHVRLNRFSIKADKSKGLTEKNVALNANVMKLFGAGNAVYIKLGEF